MKGSPKPRPPSRRPPPTEAKAPPTEAGHICQPGVDKCDELPREAAIVALAERQHGPVSLGQLLLVGGLSRAAVAKRAQDGRLYRVHQGVYAVGRPHLTAHGRWMAAVLACGPGAVLSHRSAAALHGLGNYGGMAIAVTVPRGSARRQAGIHVHRSRTLTDADVTTVDGIPCTTVARTLVDLGDVVNRRRVEKAVDQAEVLRVFDLRVVNDALERAGPRRGAGLLRAVLAAYAGPTITRREFEERMLALCRRASLPAPEVNEWLTLDDGVAYQPDFLWRASRLIVETDGRDVHTTAKAFEHDRERDQRLTVAGYTVVRFTWRQLRDEPGRVAGTVARLLAKRSPGAVARLARP